MLAVSVLALAPAAAEAASRVSADFNGDGAADLAVGVPREDVGILTDAGMVNVIYGSGGGLTEVGDQRWTQDSPGIADVAESGDWFGWSLTAGDFNGDGLDDLAVGTPLEGLAPVGITGAVHVIYGAGATGLGATGNQIWSQDTPGIEDAAESQDFFGWSLTAGDFDGDGDDDLAVGVEREDISTNAMDAGAVNVIYSSSGALRAPGDQFWTQDSAGILDIAEQHDLFGSKVGAGDFDGDAVDDLAIGVPDESLGAVSKAGEVQAIYGSGAGLSAAGDQRWSQDSPAIAGTGETGERLGQTLAIGDFDGDGADDLAAAAPFATVGPRVQAGEVNAIYGSGAGLTAAGDQLWSQDSAGIMDVAEGNDQFGQALTAGDFDGDGADDLAAGSPDESVGPIADAGMVSAIYGSAGGLTAAGDQIWTQNSAGIADVAESGDDFGISLSAGDFDNDVGASDDLAIGARRETLGAVEDAGAVSTLYGSGAGLTSAGNQFWHQNSPGIFDLAETNDQFGIAAPGSPSVG